MESARPAVVLFVFACSHPARSLERPDLFPEFLHDAPAWREAFALAERTGLVSPLLERIERSPWKTEIPEATLVEYAERLSRERLTAALFERERDSALELLESARIPALLFGPLELRRRRYPVPELRGAGPADVLLLPEAFYEGLSVLGRAGYPATASRGRVSLARQSPYCGVNVHRAMPSDDGFESRITLTEAVWDRSTALPGGRRARLIADEDHAAHAICSGVIGDIARMPLWLNDLHALTARAEFRWDALLGALAERRGLSAGWFALELLAREWGGAPPSPILEAVARKVRPVRRWFYGRCRGVGELCREDGRGGLPRRLRAPGALAD